MALSDFIKKNRMMYFSGDFTEENARKAAETLWELSCEDPMKDIIILIDSYGGYIDSFIAVHDTIKMIPCDVITVCVGKAMSCGQMLLMSGTKGKRFITPNSRIMVHQVASGAHGKLSNMEVSVAETKRIDAVFRKLIKKYSKASKKEIDEYMKQDTFMHAKEALKMGFVDHILTSPAQFNKKVLSKTRD
jgi:ATP-dependent Clp protease protease subunit